MLDLKKGDVVIYLANMHYGLANGQTVSQEGEKLFIRSDVQVQKKYFNLIQENIQEDKKEINDVQPGALDATDKEVKNQKKSKK